jgi:fatty acid/phospholipid biosynthesis enzyme
MAKCTYGESVVLDLGANIKSDSQYLVDNAILGQVLHQYY